MVSAEHAGVDVGQHAHGRRNRQGDDLALRAWRARVSVERRLQAGAEVVERLLGLVERDVAALDERLGVELADRAAGVDALVHERLRVARVVALVVAVAAVADHVDDDVLVERLAEVVGQRATRTHASGSSPFTWKIGAWIILATSVQYSDERADSGEVVKPSWLLMIRWMVPPTR